MDRNPQINEDGNEKEHPDEDDILAFDDRQDVEFQDDADRSKANYLSLGDIPDLRDSHWPVNVIAAFTMLSGLAGAIQPLAAKLAHHPKLFSLVIPYDYYHFSKSLHVAFGLFLTYLSFNLFKRKRNAWLAALILSSLSAALHASRIGAEQIKFIADKDIRELIPALTVILPSLTVVLLLAYRRQFTVRSEKYTLKTGLAMLLFSVFLAVGYGTLGFWLLERHDFGINFELSDAFLRALRELFFIGNPDLIPKGRSAIWFVSSLHLFGALTAVLAVYGLFRPIHYRLSTHPIELEQAKALHEKYGKDALDHYKILPDKSYYFLPGGNSYVAYKTVLNIAIGLGDPIAPDHEVEKVTSAFRSFARENDWKTAYLQVKPDNVDLYKKLGFDVLKVGEEAIIDLDQFVAKTVKGKNFKSKVKKFDTDGYRLERHPAPHTKDLIDTVQRVSDEWLSLPGRRERGFSLGWFDREEVEHDTLFILKDAKGEVLAFVNQVRSYAPGEASIDMMRHKENVPNGTMDFLFAKLLTALHADGYKTFNLGLAALSGVGGEPGASMEERAIHQIYEHMNRFFSYKGLRQYKNKFSPTWKASYLVYEGGTPGLIKTALAITRAGELSFDE